ncbi:DUF373 family protein [Candidatus Bathyarchaeota archaeon]|nr:DUF373 family protein [Candidatus Bathyarchaeota archaeon]
MVTEEKRDHILILCVDRDNDVGEKTKIQTPILDREANLKAATTLALTDPEEADANAMFAAIKLYDQLQSKDSKIEYHIATITGSSLGGIEADRKLASELENVLKIRPSSQVILVTDGFSDESIIPIIQSRTLITSIYRVVVKHSERIEESWALFFKYFKMLINEPHYSRFFLGVPGIMLMILGILLVFNQLENAGMALTFILGAALLVRGFGWDKKLSAIRFVLPPPERQLILASLSVGIIVAIVGSYQGVVNASKLVEKDAPYFWLDYYYWLQLSPRLISAFIISSIDLIIIGVMVALLGGFASYYIQKDPKKWQNLVGIIVAFWLRFILIESAFQLSQPDRPLTLWSPLVVMTFWGVLTTVTAVFFIYGAYKKLPPFRK